MLLKHIKPKSIDVITLNEAFTLIYGNQTQLAKLLGVNRLTIKKHLDRGDTMLVRVNPVEGTDEYTLEYINQ